jgi:serine/threonine protein kinase
MLQDNYETTTTKKWAAALKSLPKPYVLPSPRIPPNYILVSKAGSGMAGDAYFCLLKEAVISERLRIKSEASQAATDLVSKLQVVKVKGTHHVYNFTRNEVQMLRTVDDNRKVRPGYLQFFDLLASNTTHSSIDWLATSTLPFCCDLRSLAKNADSMPEEFVWHLYKQLHQALDFLHYVCKPSITHGDVHAGNVIIGYSSPYEQRLPHVKLIDFGCATAINCDGENAHLRSIDLRGMLNILASFTFDAWWDDEYPQFKADEPSPEYMGLQDRVVKGLDEGAVPKTVRDIWRLYGATAERKVANVSDASQKKIQNLVACEASSRYNFMDNKIGELLSSSTGVVDERQVLPP